MTTANYFPAASEETIGKIEALVLALGDEAGETAEYSDRAVYVEDCLSNTNCLHELEGAALGNVADLVVIRRAFGLPAIV